MRASCRSLLGLSSRAIIVTSQRFLDCWSVLRMLRDPYGAGGVGPCLLLIGLILTSLLMGFTMSRHWSAAQRGNSYGRVLGFTMACFQIAPIGEMLDKVLFAHRPRDQADSAMRAARQPLLANESVQTRHPSQAARSDLPKGSPGENAMRGVRKMSMVNLPQAMLSLWVHARQLAPVGSGESMASSRTHSLLGIAFFAAYLCVAFGIADFVLYIWVHDAFVRNNKKLVTVHYCVEIMCRVPVVVLFHVAYSRQFRCYWPTLVVFVVDVLLTSTLLLTPRLLAPHSWPELYTNTGRILPNLPCRCTKNGIVQFLYSLVVSVTLFMVNIVYFDPGMTFFYVNGGFYLVKYVELGLMLHIIHKCKSAGIPVLSPSSVFDAFWWFILCCAALNAFLVYFWIPLKRQQRFACLNSASPGDSGDDHSADALSMSSRSPRVLVPGGDGGHMLEHLEEIFEMLRLLSTCSCSRNRSRLLAIIVSELWHQALRWDGEWEDEQGTVVQIYVHRPLSGSARLRFPANAAGAGNSREECVQALLDGPKIVLMAAAALGSGVAGSGFSDGVAIHWDSGKVWRRSGDEHDTVGRHARSVLRLILPQLALALRWDLAATPPHVGEHVSRDVEAMEAGVPTRMTMEAVVPPTDAPSAPQEASGSSRPLLNFLFRYAVMTRQADFISELYWALHCLSDEERSAVRSPAPSSHSPSRIGTVRCYCAARRTLLLLLLGPARDLVAVLEQDLRSRHVEAERSVASFLQEAGRQLGIQHQLWNQKLDFMRDLQHTRWRELGAGGWVHRTAEFRDALRKWPDARRMLRAGSRDEDWQLLQAFCQPFAFNEGERQAMLRNPSLHQLPRHISDSNFFHVDFVHPESGGSDMFVSLPIDPTVEFQGVVIDDCEVVPSKHAPLLFTCMTRTKIGELSEEKYLLKTGDDLRQDQLMLQIMALMGCVWQEKLDPADVRLLQLAQFRVLAVTPHSGYVKFVHDAVALTDALHASHGDLIAWLEQNRPPELPFERVLENLCGSVAASSVVTYVLGIGDRHLENLLITRRGQFFHVDFSFVLGDDPKPCAPQVRVPQQVAQALLDGGKLGQCFDLAARAYKALRPFAGLWGSILQLTAAAGGAGCPKLSRGSEQDAVLAGVRERLRVEEADEERAASEFLCLVRESSEGLASILLDKVHAAGLFWR